VPRACQSCGKTDNIRNCHYCSVKCRQHLRQKLTIRNGLLEALNARHATFYFTEDKIVMDVIVRDIPEVFRYSSRTPTGGRSKFITPMRAERRQPSEKFMKLIRTF